MRIAKASSCLAVAFVLASCTNSNGIPTPGSGASGGLPGPSNAIAVPSGVTTASGFSVHVFAAPPSGSTKPDSIVQIGHSIFVGFGDTVGPDGTPGTGGQTSVEIVQYDLSGNYQKTYTVPGHNDGLMAFNSTTLWAMSNEDANPKLTVINLSAGTQSTYVPQAGLENGSGALAHGGGLDDMQMIGGNVYVSASNPTAVTGTCPANSSTPGCPNGISTGAFVYALTLNSDGTTFNLTPVATDGSTATNIATTAAGTLNVTDPDSEVVTPDGTTLIVDGQGDSELAFIKNPGAGQSLSFLDIAGGQQLDDTRFAPNVPTFLLVTDTPANLIYRIDGAFTAGGAYSSGNTATLNVNMTTGSTTPVLSGLQAPHGEVFVTAP